jgi:short-subunit dehydrogenase
VALSLKDKVVLITGASSGFGADAASLFAREGATVLLAARRVDRLTALAEKIRLAGGQAFAVPLDVSEPSQVEEAVQTILENFGRIDILVNNAGFGRLDWLENLDPVRDIQAQIAVNFSGLVHLTRCVLPHMYRRGSGHIINMASVAGLIAPPLYTIYAATKYAVRGFTDSLRREAAPFGVRVSGIYPGPAATEFGHHSGDNPVKRNLKLPKFLSMTSVSVARRILRLALHPRRTVVIPGYYRLAVLIDSLFPGLVDWILKVIFVRRFHRPASR